MRNALFASLALVVSLTACDHAPAEPSSHASPGAAPAPPPTSAPSHIAARHVLIMHRGSERAPATITRTRDEALARANTVLARARRGDDFTALAREFSDEPGARTSGGDLGTFGHGQMVPQFEQAAFALGVGQTSEVVETIFGFHIIRRTQ